MRCSTCGHDSPPGSLFCLNCGTSLGAGPGQTPGAAPGLPLSCPTCRADNPPGMKFCRNCGTVLAAAPSPGIPPSPVLGGPGAGYPAPSPAYPQQGGYGAPAPAYPPAGQASPVEPPATTTTCGRCGALTPSGFAFCQQCGQKLVPPAAPGVDAHGATLAVSGDQAVRAGLVPGSPSAPAPAQSAPRPAPAAASGLVTPSPASLVPAQAQVAPGAAWGTAVSVNRDGTDGDRYPLVGEFVVIGRAGAGISFDQDRFLAREHARLELGAGGARVVPLDSFNGVFRKLDAPVELRDGDVVLLGREVLRFEVVDADEKNPLPLVRHGVALFGSPPREPWGRLLQVVPSGGVRDVRHLWDDEIILGREEGDLVYSDDAFLSRRHASFTWDGKRVLLTDLGSSNGTFFRLAGPHPLKHNEHLRMGDQLFRIELAR
jgi:pSer/pThr/pTyr-binding forkhead associated (FHA) protein